MQKPLLYFFTWGEGTDYYKHETSELFKDHNTCLISALLHSKTHLVPVYMHSFDGELAYPLHKYEVRPKLFH